MRTDFDQLEEGQKITLHPRPDNPLKKYPHDVIYYGGYFYSENGIDGPDYYLGDVFRYNFGFTEALS